MHPQTAGLVITTDGLLEAVHAALQDLPVRIILEQPRVDDWTAFLDKLERIRPDVLIVDLASVGDSFREVAQRLRALPEAPAVMAVHTAADPETILAAMRVGVTEYLYPPLEDGLRNALERVSTERAERRRSASVGGKTLAFFSAKGGCGATTIACHSAVEFQRQTTQEVLLADFDMQAGLIGFLMKTKSGYSILDAVKNIHRLDLSFWKALISNGQPRLQVIGAPASTASLDLPTKEPLREIVRFVRAHYDWILIDLGRGLSLAAMDLLEEIDFSYLVTTLDVPALYQAKQIVQTLLNSGYGRDRLRLIVSQAPKRGDVTGEELEKMFSIPIFSVLPADREVLYESYAEGHLAPANSNLGKQFARLVGKMRGAEEPKKRGFSMFG